MTNEKELKSVKVKKLLNDEIVTGMFPKTGFARSSANPDGSFTDIASLDTPLGEVVGTPEYEKPDDDKVVEDINCYKYCVDTHKYVLVGKVISKRGSQGELDEEVIFFSSYPIEDTHINRAYLYTWFYLLDDNYRSFTPKNEVRQLLYGSENNYVIGYLDENGEPIYYDQFVGAN